MLLGELVVFEVDLPIHFILYHIIQFIHKSLLFFAAGIPWGIGCGLDCGVEGARQLQLPPWVFIIDFIRQYHALRLQFRTCLR